MGPKPAKRKPGRPPLAPTEDTQLTLRRERDRVAQRQSRLRKAYALSERDERIDKLSRTIEGLTSVFTDFNELVFGSRIVQADVESARRLKHLADRFLTVAQDAAAETHDEEDYPSRPSSQHSASPAAPVISNALLTTPSAFFTQALPPPPDLPSRPWSPRLTYGLVTNPENCTASAHSRIPPCLTRPRKTFAWRLLQETFTRAYPLWEAAGTVPPPPELDEIFRLTKPHEGVRELAQKLMLVVEYLFCVWGTPLTARTKGLARDSAAFRTLEGSALAARERMLMLAMLIKRDLHLAGEDLADYMHAFELHAYLERAWGLDLSTTSASLAPGFWGPLHEASAPAGSPAAEIQARMLRDDDFHLDAAPVVAPADAVDAPADLFAAPAAHRVTVDIDDLVRKLVKTAICFGSGPRYYKPHVDRVISQFLTENGLVTALPVELDDTADTLAMDFAMPVVTA